LEFSWLISRWTNRMDGTFFAASKKPLHIVDITIFLVSSRYLKIWSQTSFGNICDAPHLPPYSQYHNMELFIICFTWMTFISTMTMKKQAKPFAKP
jgi:hypothetical protein